MKAFASFSAWAYRSTLEPGFDPAFDTVREFKFVGQIEDEFNLENIFRLTNRVTDEDADYLDSINYRLPSMSVGDIVKLDDRWYRCEPVGWCELHDVPSMESSDEFEAWMREKLLEGIGVFG